jgi:hypothetical protein
MGLENSALRPLLSCLYVQNIQMPGWHETAATLVVPPNMKVGGGSFGPLTAENDLTN